MREGRKRVRTGEDSEARADEELHWMRHQGSKKVKHGNGAPEESAEDIAKWIEERKKRFPTRANVEKKVGLLAFVWSSLFSV